MSHRRLGQVAIWFAILSGGFSTHTPSTPQKARDIHTSATKLPLRPKLATPLQKDEIVKYKICAYAYGLSIAPHLANFIADNHTSRLCGRCGAYYSGGYLPSSPAPSNPMGRRGRSREGASRDLFSLLWIATGSLVFLKTRRPDGLSHHAIPTYYYSKFKL